MGVGIKYTGVDGKTDSFTSTSADEAIGRLSRISGYSRNQADRITATLADGWRARHKARSRENVSRLNGITGGGTNDVYSHDGGIAFGEMSVGGVGVRNGRVVSFGRKRYISSDGNVVGYGPRVERDFSDIGLSSDIDLSKDRSRIDALEADAKEKKRTFDELEKKMSGKVQDVVTGVDFSMGDDGLEIIVSKAKANVIDVGNQSTTRQKFGEKITVHENMNDDEHSEVIVLGKKKSNSTAARIAAKAD